MIQRDSDFPLEVHCRIGSLENTNVPLKSFRFVHCRIGSLESTYSGQGTVARVHCRIGSLEKILVTLH